MLSTLRSKLGNKLFKLAALVAPDKNKKESIKMVVPQKNSTIGKTVMVALWVGVSGAIASLIVWVGGLDWGNLAWLAPSINTVLVFAKNFADKEVANF